MSTSFTYNNTAIIPAPQVSIKSNLLYSNDNPIGYEYSVILKGYAIADTDEISFGGTISKVKEIIEILSNNGSSLIISNDNGTLIEGIGGVLIDLEFDSSNSFSSYSNYTATLAFSELNILDDSFSCSSSRIQNNSFSADLLDINTYKIKEFNDSWNFTLDDSTFNFNDDAPSPIALSIYNTQLNISYTISATGFTYFNSDKEVIAAWQQAKNFVQDRLFKQITAFHSKQILELNGNTACSASQTLSSIHDTSANGIINNLSAYDVCNETINCSTSEANGTFSAEYNAILKFNDSASAFGGRRAIHTFSKKLNTSYDGSREVISVTIDGTIQGLNSSNLSTDIIFGGFSLPNNGVIIKSGNNFDKMANAIVVKNKIIKDTEEDLILAFKSGLGITTDLFNLPNCEDIDKEDIRPTTFSLTKNNFLGSINYTAEYSSNRSLALEDNDIVIYNTSIDIDNPLPVYVELPIVSGDYIIQDLDTVTNHKINVIINGKKKDANSCCLSLINTNNIKSIMDFFTFPNQDNYILTNKNISYTWPNSNFTISASYLCQSGCPL